MEVPMATPTQRFMKPITLGIAGGTGAGKTTLARAIYQRVGGEKNAVYLTHDHYYKDLSHQPPEERWNVNFDHPDSLETDLLVQHVKDLQEGKPALLPTYDFKTHTRTPITTYVHPKPIIIVEGILVLSQPALCDVLDVKVFVDADNDTRVVRRIARDKVERGMTVDAILAQYQETVKPMHSQFVQPSKVHADVIVNSETGNSVDIAISMLASYLKSESGVE
eukprot:Nitzschia sp. Nitz4//scaffold213_size37731//15867//16730//NITZ4_007719-RA/size37731-augustus-gene-0.34-mRNA-1//1//CDS//3329542062//9424//frame0